MDENTQQIYDDPNEENQKNEANTANHSRKLHGSGSSHKTKQNKSQYNQRKRYSRSRSPNSIKSSKQWISTNPFINFVRDFRQSCAGMKSTKIYQLAGERWNKMSAEQKQPYVDAATDVKNQKQLQQKNESINKLETDTESKNENVPKQDKVKRVNKNKEPKKRVKKKSDSESESGSATSITSGSVSSGGTSDTS